MKLFDVDWATVLSELPRFSMLSLTARAVLLEVLKTSGYAPGALFGEQRDEIVACGIPTFDAERNRLILAEEHRELLKVLRAMARHPVFDAPSIPSLFSYLEEHFTNDDVNRIGGNSALLVYGQVTRYTLGPRIAYAGWPGDLLAAVHDADVLAWGAARGVISTGRTTLSELRALQALVQQLVMAKEAVPLSVAYAKLAKRERVPFANALHLGLKTVVLFAGMRGRDLEPMIGLWPTALQELLRPPAVKPTEVVPVEQFGAAILMEDMTALLATVVAAPVRLRANDLAVFAKTRAEIETRVVPIPAWAAPFAGSPEQARVSAAAGILQWRALVEVQAHHQNPHLMPTAAGTKWLALSSHDRLAALLKPMRESKARNPRGSYEPGDDEGFFPFSLPYYREPKGLRLRDALTNAFVELGDGFYAVESFLDFAARQANPFSALKPEEKTEIQRQMYFGGIDARDAFSTLWRSALLGFLVSRLVVFGGATLGRLRTGECCFALTDIGRYLLGATDRFVYGGSDTTDIVVQPNFDVVFLGAAPSLEAAMARVSERVGVAPGLAFRITRASVMRAAESGLTVDAVLSTLTDASSKPVPKNVQREIVGWMAAVRRVQLRKVEVIDCGHEETVDRIMALFGSKLTRLTTTMIELPATTPSARAALIKKLRAGGVFLEDQSGRAKAVPARRRRVEPTWDEE